MDFIIADAANKCLFFSLKMEKKSVFFFGKNRFQRRDYDLLNGNHSIDDGIFLGGQKPLLLFKGGVFLTSLAASLILKYLF